MVKKKTNKKTKLSDQSVELVEAEVLNPEEGGPGESNQEQEPALQEIEVLPLEAPLDELLPIDVEYELVPEKIGVQDPISSVSRKDIVPYDALTAYLREVAQYPRLSKEEEVALSERYLRDKDLAAAYKLVTSNLWLVVKVSRDYERAARSLLDLIQEGNLGLMEAVKNFDPYRGVRLPSYAVWWIKAYIIRFLIANWRMVKIGTTQAQRKLFFNLKKEKEKLEREGFYPGQKLLAEKLQVKESEVLEMEQRLNASDLSVDAPLDQDQESSLLSVLPSNGLNAEEQFANKEMLGQLRESLEHFRASLNSKELLIFDQRIIDEEKKTLHEISEQLKISKERVRQIEGRIKQKLKAYFEQHFEKPIELGDF